ncbi:manganese efflux pump MntP family protein [Paenibacillus chartarius]|uniref:Putative manganese efflux pump MntP n=1 Tax=Paenibacillus chartarius TaxID=747481 RepID=A0ABV6DUU6_9BACL
MMAAVPAFGQIITITIMAIALGMDAFSLGLGMGMRGIRLRDILKISLVIGFFHVIMPLIGMFMGQYVSALLGNVATAAGGTLLILLGAHMVYSSIKGESVQSFDHRTLWGLLVFSLSVSIDSFSVGVSLGMFSGDQFLTVMAFGLSGLAMSMAGLLLGRNVANWIGEWGEAIGGVILLAFGLKFLFL